MRVWTDQEISVLVSMWPTASIMQIANTLHRSPGSISDKAKGLREKGLLEGTKGKRTKTMRGGQRSIQSNPICKTSTQ